MPRHAAWFAEARYGMFIHWGLYSLLGRGEWARNRERIPDEEYVALADRFRAEGFNARAWARIAADAGMRYSVLTSKHHDGFCLWNSQTCAFNSMNAACRRDLLREWVEAFRSEGLKVGVYYSLGDWHNPDWIGAVRGDEACRVRFVQYTRALLSELLSGYGRIDILWYDLPQGLTAEQWESASLNQMARRLQPDILINNRSMLPEDFSVREQSLHGAPAGRMWESCLTLNESWAYVAGDHDYKSARAVARSLARAAGGGGNLLLNVGPDGTGQVTSQSREIILEAGEWLKRVGSAVYGASGEGMTFNLWGGSTYKAPYWNLFIERWMGQELVIGGLGATVLEAEVLGHAIPLRISTKGRQTILSGLPMEPPDPVLTVLRLKLDGPPDQDISRVIGGADIMANFPD